MVKIRYEGMRKVIKINETYYLSIPKKVARQMHIDEGDEVLMFLTEDNRIMLSPAEKEERDI